MLFSKLNLDPGETIVLEVRRHWFVFVLRTFFILLLAVIPLVLYGVIVQIAPQSVAAFFNDNFFVALFLYSVWILFLWMTLFIQWTDYYLDVWYITEKRIIDVEQKGIFHREVSNLRFDKVQDISIKVRGIIATFMKFGDLHVQTAAENSRGFVMKNAARPDEVRRVIFSSHNREAEKMHKPAPEIIDVAREYGNHEPL